MDAKGIFEALHGLVVVVVVGEQRGGKRKSKRISGEEIYYVSTAARAEAAVVLNLRSVNAGRVAGQREGAPLNGFMSLVIGYILYKSAI